VSPFFQEREEDAEAALETAVGKRLDATHRIDGAWPILRAKGPGRMAGIPNPVDPVILSSCRYADRWAGFFRPAVLAGDDTDSTRNRVEYNYFTRLTTGGRE